MLSGSAFYDDVYHHQNDNDAPDTVNKLGPDGLTTPDPDYRKFSSETRFRDGQRARLLEAYVYGTWWLGDESSINLRLRSEEHTSELQSLMRTSYAVFCLKKKKYPNTRHYHPQHTSATRTPIYM